MTDFDSEKSSVITASDNLNMVRGVTRREFVKYSAGAVAGLCMGGLTTACGIGRNAPPIQPIQGYPISGNVVKTTEQMLAFPMPATPSGPDSGTGLYPTELPLISQYAQYGYGAYEVIATGLPVVPRYDLLPDPDGYAKPARHRQLAHFFAMTDIHITDKEAPNQLIYIQQADARFGAPVTSIYSPVMLYTPHVLDAAIQTINALHQKTPFDFGISLGDTCNNTQYNELRWYLDIIDGKVITPSSGAHLGADCIDYQKPFQAAGLDKSIPWYQVLGNHDHFYIGSIAVDADPTLGIRDAYVGNKVWAIGDLLRPNQNYVGHHFPCMFDSTFNLTELPQSYMGVIDGSTPTGTIKHAGPRDAISPPPMVTADPHRRSLLRTEWIAEFFETQTLPVGHGFGLVDPAMGEGFACYSFAPKADIPLKIIVLDDTQSETDGSRDIHGHGVLDEARWNWLKAELETGQRDHQLMIVAAHVPIAVSGYGSELEWWDSGSDPNATEQNAVTLTELVATLQKAPNLLMWIAGHRHLNTIKGFPSPDRINAPEKGFWQVETSSLRDFPQQFRTFEIYLNSDYTVSIVATNVDPAVADGTPAATSRTYAVATQQIVKTKLRVNSENVPTIYGRHVDPMDPTRPQDGSLDPTIAYGEVSGVPYCASYNAELYKQLSPSMVRALQAMFPTAVS